MTKKTPPYLLMSDQHCHSWGTFSTVDASGVNNRLKHTLNEIYRAYQILSQKGGEFAVFAGDLFHVRGHIEPSVFNPTHKLLSSLHSDGEFCTMAIAGNHDLESYSAMRLGSAIQTLDEMKGFYVAAEPTPYKVPGGTVVLVPWIQNVELLRETLKKLALEHKSAGEIANTDLVIHAPVNGIITGLPETGLNADELADLGFRRVFSGHYHHHKEMCDGKVISIGATTHQTWSDVGSRAGFILVYPDHIEHVESSAPKFIDLAAAGITDMLSLQATVCGNYARLKIGSATEAEIKEWKETLREAGAEGQLIITTKKGVTRTGAGSVAAGQSIEVSVMEFVSKNCRPELLSKIKAECADVLSVARENA